MNKLKPLIQFISGILVALTIYHYQDRIIAYWSSLSPRAIFLIVIRATIIGAVSWWQYWRSTKTEAKKKGNKSNWFSRHRSSQESKRQSAESHSRQVQQTIDPNSAIDAACREIGIHPQHTYDQLKRHWKLTCRQWHPDTGGSNQLWLQKHKTYEMLLRLAKEREGLH